MTQKAVTPEMDVAIAEVETPSTTVVDIDGLYGPWAIFLTGVGTFGGEGGSDQVPGPVSTTTTQPAQPPKAFDKPPSSDGLTKEQQATVDACQQFRELRLAGDEFTTAYEDRSPDLVVSLRRLRGVFAGIENLAPIKTRPTVQLVVSGLDELILSSSGQSDPGMIVNQIDAGLQQVAPAITRLMTSLAPLCDSVLADDLDQAERIAAGL